MAQEWSSAPGSLSFCNISFCYFARYLVLYRTFSGYKAHLPGLDHQWLSFYHNGMDRRLTDVEGHLIEGSLT